jgi:hypothetical protein
MCQSYLESGVLQEGLGGSLDEAFVYYSRLCRSVLTFQSSLSSSSELELLLQLKDAILIPHGEVHEELKHF